MASDRTNRIAKNTVMLYFRLAFTMVVALYTSRVVLNTLGVVDYGINSVVAGTVGFLSFFIYSMNTATQRFLNVAMGEEDDKKCHYVYSISIIVHFAIVLVVLLMGETVGLWLIYNKLIIPIERMNAAFWVFQFTIITTATSVMSIPYNAMVVAHERMHIYAYFSMLEVFLKLIILYLLVLSPCDKLITYSFLYMCTALLNRFLFTIYCKRNFPECKFSIYFPRSLLREMTSFAGWDLLGVFAWICSHQGTTILINMFFGPAVNASKAIAERVRGAVNSFSSNFLTSLRPQITQSYASGDTSYLHKLMYTGSKMSFVLLYTMALPFFVIGPLLLRLWLKIVPDYSVIFLQFVLVDMILNGMMNPLNTAALATGRIRYYGLLTSILTILNIPFCYVVLKLGGSPISVFIILLLTSFLRIGIQFFKLKKLVSFSYTQYLKEVQLHCIAVVLITFPLALITSFLITNNFWGLLLFCILCCPFTLVLCFGIVFNRQERTFMWEKITVVLKKYKLNK